MIPLSRPRESGSDSSLAPAGGRAAHASWRRPALPRIAMIPAPASARRAAGTLRRGAEAEGALPGRRLGAPDRSVFSRHVKSHVHGT